jgi:phospholipase D1/2
MVAAELTYKICQKIALGERFSAYIVIPMWPEGLPSATSVQDILCYQGYTISFMYKKIHRAIVNKRKTSKDYKGIKVTDYLSFFTLANRETNDGGQDMVKEGILNQTRRHLIYVVSLSI